MLYFNCFNWFPAVWISNYLTMEEMGLYRLQMGISYNCWMDVVFRILNIHEYGLFKTILTFILTIADGIFSFSLLFLMLFKR